MANRYIMQKISISKIRGIGLILPKIILGRDDIWLSAQVHSNGTDKPELFVYASITSTPTGSNTGYVVYHTKFDADITSDDEQFTKDVVRHLENADSMYETIEKLIELLGV